MKRVWVGLFVAAILWIAALTQWGLQLAVDEVEFFRATKWVGQGLRPFRDFWEHHLPLQWFVFGPIARLFANGPGVESIVVMRWAQMAMWIAIFALLVRFMRRAGLDPWPSLVLLLVSASFVRKAIEYRVDVPGNLAYVAGVALIAFGAGTRRWLGFGALMSLAVLANMRLAPLVIVTAALALFWRAEERRWRWNGRALWMLGGVVPVVAAFVGWLSYAGAWPKFIDGVFHYNATSARLLEVDTFFDALLMPLWTLDVAGVAFWIAGIAGAALVLRNLREPGPLQFVALLFAASVGTIALMEVQYDYHFQNAYLLMLPLAALAISRVRTVVPAIVAAGALGIALIQTVPSFGEAMEYQDAVMTSADRLTSPEEKVLDGGGFALRRKPAYRYWFLTTGVRFMAAKGMIEPFKVTSWPPGAIIYDYRLALYLRDFPDLARYATKHYVPVYRNLWVPGMALIARAALHPNPLPAPGERGQSAPRHIWVAPRAGTYDVWASEALLTHPWLTKPLEYAAIEGPLATRYVIPLAQLPPSPPEALQWRVDGVPQPRGTRSLKLRTGSRVELSSAFPRPTGVLLVPRGIGALCISTAEEKVF
ncbi:MAG TPA: hypothetical protein VFV49_02170 [Thermoanaerobaculia bacterium]|nr:hypothetical protein [Thermoanaerobaculia bacterium]